MTAEPPPAHDHPVPAADKKKSPFGIESITVVVPVVGPVPRFSTRSVKTPVPPTVKLPVWVLLTVIFGKGFGIAIVRVKALLAVAGVPAESVTSTVKLNTPDAVGVPEIVPVTASSANPGGSAPAEIDQVYGGIPPVAVIVWL